MTSHLKGETSRPVIMHLMRHAAWLAHLLIFTQSGPNCTRAGKHEGRPACRIACLRCCATPHQLQHRHWRGIMSGVSAERFAHCLEGVGHEEVDPRQEDDADPDWVEVLVAGCEGTARERMRRKRVERAERAAISHRRLTREVIEGF